MSDPLYIRLGQTVRGPYSLDDLRELASRGSFSKAHEVSADKKSWMSASARPELFPEVNRPPSLERKQQNTTPGNLGTKSGVSEPVEPLESEEQSTFRSSKKESPNRSISPADVTQGTAETVAGRPVAVQTILAVIVGPAGFLLLLACTAMIVMRLRVASFVPASNIDLIAMLGVNLLLGLAAVILGHLAIVRFHRLPGTVTERNLIVIGLSCGYTILILSLLFTVVLLISAFG